MANKIIVQDCEIEGQADILVKMEGYPADHYLRVPTGEVDVTVEEAGGNLPGVELVDLRAGR